MWLASGRMQCDFSAPAQRHAKRSDYNRLGRKFDCLCHPLELANGEINVVPLFFLSRHEQEHEIRAH